ncbi:uncharacterized protein LOC141589932 [Silene latifolia]|uniref:uncharacterized protein LOC141589932 n=1 Tax=Silene latifolia TaxID=37657 RepID=UPI003D777BB7
MAQTDLEYLGIENHIHLFQTCEYTRKIFDELGQLLDVALPATDLVHLVASRQYSKLKKGVLLCAVLAAQYHIWLQRNQARVAGCILRPTLVVSQIMKLLKMRVGSRLQPNLIWRSGISREIFVRWVDLNIDGASKVNPRPSRAGGIFRNSAGQIIEAFAKKLGVATVRRAEFMALRRGLMIAIERKVPKLNIQTDSMMVANIMEMVEAYPSAHSHLMQICKAFIDDTVWQVRIQHVNRKANSCADWMANLGVQQPIDYAASIIQKKN